MILLCKNDTNNFHIDLQWFHLNSSNQEEWWWLVIFFRKKQYIKKGDLVKRSPLDYAFASVQHIMMDVPNGAILRYAPRQKFGNLDISESGLRRPSIQNQAENERLSMRNTLKNNSILQI